MFVETTAARQFIAHYTTTVDMEADLDKLASACKQELAYQDSIQKILVDPKTEVSQDNLEELQRQQEISCNLSNQWFASIWSKSMGVVAHAARSINGGAATSADVYSYALETLMRSLRKWDDTKPIKFSSYFYGNIQRELYTLTNRKHFRDLYAHTVSVDFTDTQWTDHLNATKLENSVEQTVFISRQAIKRNIYTFVAESAQCAKNTLTTSTTLKADLGLDAAKLQELFTRIRTYYKLDELTELADASWLSTMTVGHLIELIHTRVGEHFNTMRELTQVTDELSASIETQDMPLYNIPYAQDTPEYQVIEALLKCNISDEKTLAKALGWKGSYLTKVLNNIKKAFPDAKGFSII